MSESLNGAKAKRSLRGKRYFEDIQSADNNKPVVNLKVNGRGRSEVLIRERNECICHRYFYYAKVCRLHYDTTLTYLYKEFFLTERTIIDIISKNHLTMKEISQKKPSKRMLQQKFPFLNWNLNNNINQ